MNGILESPPQTCSNDILGDVKIESFDQLLPQRYKNVISFFKLLFACTELYFQSDEYEENKANDEKDFVIYGIDPIEVIDETLEKWYIRIKLLTLNGFSRAKWYHRISFHKEVALDEPQIGRKDTMATIRVRIVVPRVTGYFMCGISDKNGNSYNSLVESFSSNKLDVIEPPPFPPHVSKYLQPGVFPEIPGGSDITDAGDYINAKYGHLGLTIYIWFTIGRLMCKMPPVPKTDQTAQTEPDDDHDLFYDEDSDAIVPDLVLDKFDPILLSYAGAKEIWYFQITLATLNNLWCDADWDHSVKHKTETSKILLSPDGDPSNQVMRFDTLSEYKIKVKIPDFWGYVRFQILDAQRRSFEQTSGCLKYRFKNFEFEATVTTKLLDKRFRTKQHKWRAPDIKISYKFEDTNYEILWYPFVGQRIPEKDDLQIPNLNKAKIKSMVDDTFDEKIKRNRDEFVKRYVRSIMEKLIPRVVEECRSKVDLVLTFATVLANGTDDDAYNLPAATSKLIKLAVYSVTKRNLRDDILRLIVPRFKMPEKENAIIENKLKDVENEVDKLRQLG